MTKEQIIERYRRGYATDEHLDTAVARGLLTVEEAESLKIERQQKGGIVKREEYEQLQENHRKLQEEHEILKATFEESVVDAEYRLLMLEAAQEPIV